MNKYKYQISDKFNQEVWVCETCKKGKSLLILTGKWKLIDRCYDCTHPLWCMREECCRDRQQELMAVKKNS